jgi:cyclopropane fatty-acyl-phospholipid synthase-like methyltransferase
MSIGCSGGATIFFLWERLGTSATAVTLSGDFFALEEDIRAPFTSVISYLKSSIWAQTTARLSSAAVTIIAA